jgi:hypothetical protein
MWRRWTLVNILLNRYFCSWSYGCVHPDLELLVHMIGWCDDSVYFFISVLLRFLLDISLFQRNLSNNRWRWRLFIRGLWEVLDRILIYFTRIPIEYFLRLFTILELKPIYIGKYVFCKLLTLINWDLSLNIYRAWSLDILKQIWFTRFIQHFTMTLSYSFYF